MSNKMETLAKMSTLPQILEAANVLVHLDLIEGPPHKYVKQYVEANPDINQLMNAVERDLDSPEIITK